MVKQDNNFAYIDGANLYTANKELGWKLDYKKFRIWLSEKYGIKKAYIFIELIPKYKNIYTYLQECGFTLIFKEVIYDGKGKPKGNCDADLVLQAMVDYHENNFDNALVVTSDGDYASLVTFLKAQGKLLGILSPAEQNLCSVLLKRTDSKIYYIDNKKHILKKEKTPNEDRTS